MSAGEIAASKQQGQRKRFAVNWEEDLVLKQWHTKSSLEQAMFAMHGKGEGVRGARELWIFATRGIGRTAGSESILIAEEDGHMRHNSSVRTVLKEQDVKMRQS